MLTATKLPLPPLTTIATAQLFANPKLPQRAYESRSLALEAMAHAEHNDILLLDVQQLHVWFAVLQRELPRYLGTHLSNGLPVRLEFPTKRHATKYRARLKRATDTFMAAIHSPLGQRLFSQIKAVRAANARIVHLETMLASPYSV